MTGLPAVRDTYTLVEFMDYECPPCRALAPNIPKLVALYKGKLRFVVRQSPLSMHKHAFAAACAAEAAREQNKFETMHHALMGSTSLLPQDLEKIAGKIGLDKAKFRRSIVASGKRTVENDGRMAKTLNLMGTPSFVVCTPRNEAYLLESLSQVKEVVR